MDIKYDSKLIYIFFILAMFNYSLIKPSSKCVKVNIINTTLKHQINDRDNKKRFIPSATTIMIVSCLTLKKSYDYISNLFNYINTKNKIFEEAQGYYISTRFYYNSYISNSRNISKLKKYIMSDDSLKSNKDYSNFDSRAMKFIIKSEQDVIFKINKYLYDLYKYTQYNKNFNKLYDKLYILKDEIIIITDTIKDHLSKISNKETHNLIDYKY